MGEHSPQQSSSYRHQECTENLLQPGRRYMVDEISAQDSSGHRSQQYGQYHRETDVTQFELEKACKRCQQNRMNNIGADHHCRREAIKDQKQHQNHTAGANRCKSHKRSGQKTDERNSPAVSILPQSLEWNRGQCRTEMNDVSQRNEHQKQADRPAEEFVYAIAINRADPSEKGYS